jgi:3-dehydroquinate synthase
MLAAGEISLAMGLWQHGDQQRQRAVIASAGLPLAWPALDPTAVLACLQGDKKVRHGRVRFVLPTAIGAVVIRDDVEPAIILLALKRLKASQSEA